VDDLVKLLTALAALRTIIPGIKSLLDWVTERRNAQARQRSLHRRAADSQQITTNERRPRSVNRKLKRKKRGPHPG
jgi:hypothetical protein